MKLVPLKSEALRSVGVPFAPASFYRWRSIGDPRARATIRLGGRIFLDLERWQQVCAELIKRDPLAERGNHGGASR